jgi:hypothetical protein
MEDLQEEETDETSREFESAPPEDELPFEIPRD